MSTRVVLSLPLLVALAAPAGALTVLQRGRVGHAVEDVDRGPGHDPVLLDGYELLSVAANGKETKLLDLRDVGVSGHTTGFAWVEPERLFAFLQPQPPLNTTLVLADDKGRPAGTRPLAYLDGLLPEHTEGVAYLGARTPWPDHLLVVAYPELNVQGAQLEILTREGQGVHRILPGPPLELAFIASAAPLGEDRLVVAVLDADLYVMDYAGNVLGGPFTTDEALGVEGVVQLKDGRVATAEYFSGKLFAHTASLARRPQQDVLRLPGRGVTGGFGLAWDSDRRRHLLRSTGPGPAPFSFQTVARSLDDVALAFHPPSADVLRARGATYMPDERRTAVGNVRSATVREIVLFGADGLLAETIDVSPVGRPVHLAYVPASQEFLLRIQEPDLRLRVVSRTGAHVRDIDLSATGLSGAGAFAYFDPTHPSGGQLLVAGGDRLVRTDLDGGLLETYLGYKAALRVLGVGGLAAITTGPQAGAFAAVDSTNSEIVVFTLP